MTEEQTQDQYYDYVPVAKQVARLRAHFPTLKLGSEELAKSEQPPGAEGWFAIPRWEALAHHPLPAIEVMLRAIAETRPFDNEFKEMALMSRLRRGKRSIGKWRQLEATQTGSILLVPAQFGLLHRGRAVADFSVGSYLQRGGYLRNEFGLGSFAVAAMLLTHPKRFAGGDRLGVYCSGDEFRLNKGYGRYEFVPTFCLQGKILKFSWRSIDSVDERFGAATAFVP